MFSAAGIQAKTVTGYLKGAGYYPDYEFGDKTDPFRGSWNAVLLDGQWRLVDTNWGSRHVTGWLIINLKKQLFTVKFSNFCL